MAAATTRASSAPGLDEIARERRVKGHAIVPDESTTVAVTPSRQSGIVTSGRTRWTCGEGQATEGSVPELSNFLPKPLQSAHVLNEGPLDELFHPAILVSAPTRRHSRDSSDTARRPRGRPASSTHRGDDGRLSDAVWDSEGDQRAYEDACGALESSPSPTSRTRTSLRMVGFSPFASSRSVTQSGGSGCV